MSEFKYNIFNLEFPHNPLPLPKPSTKLFYKLYKKTVTESYDTGKDFSLNINDDLYAFTKACDETDWLLENKIEKELEISTTYYEHERNLLKHITNFFKCLDYRNHNLINNYYEKASFLLIVLAWFNYFNEIKKIVSSSYNSYIELVKNNSKDLELFRPLAFSDLYFILGNVCLLEKHKITDAFDFYRYATYDWSKANPVKKDHLKDSDFYKRIYDLYKLAYYEDDPFITEKILSHIILDKQGSSFGLKTNILLRTDLDTSQENVDSVIEDFDELFSIYYDIYHSAYNKKARTEKKSDEEKMKFLTGTVSSAELKKDFDSKLLNYAPFLLILRIRNKLLAPVLASLNKVDEKIKSEIANKFFSDIASNIEMGEFYENDVFPDFIKVFISITNDSFDDIISEGINSNIFPFEDISDLKTNKTLSDRFDLLISLAEFINTVNNIKTLLQINSHDVSNLNLCYYTSFSTLGHMLWNIAEDSDNFGKYSIMHMAYMNDPNEGNAINQLISMKQFQNENGRKKINYPYVFLKCFTNQIDDLPMWNMYGNNAEGICVVIDGRGIKNKFVDNRSIVIPNLYYVCYIDQNNSIQRKNNLNLKEKVPKINNNLNTLKNHIQKLSKAGFSEYLEVILEQIKYLFKFSDYSHEQEVRLLYSFSKYDENQFKHTLPEECDKEHKTLLYYQPDFIPLIKEIIIGPKFKESTTGIMMIQESLDKLYDKINLGSPMSRAIAVKPIITKSNVEFR